MLNSRRLVNIEQQFKEEVQKIDSSGALENLRIKYLGRKSGIVTELLAEIPKLPLAERKKLAPEIIKLKKTLGEVLSKIILKTKDGRPAQSTTEDQFDWEIDPSLVLGKSQAGHPHPTQLVIHEIKEIFHYLGFGWQDGPEVELDIYNFQKLRLHKDHPARDTQQTYYLSEDILLRTQTSSMQIRYMESHKPPLRMLFPGRVYRREQIDATHLPAFYQIEGLLVDQTTNLTELLGTLDFFAKKMFGSGTKTRIYGHHFPYTEPSIEVEVLFEGRKWLEIMGAGMVHPEVLKNCGIDPKKYRGWAFGMGPERIAMIKYGIEDIRLFYSNNLNFLEQF